MAVGVCPADDNSGMTEEPDKLRAVISVPDNGFLSPFASRCLSMFCREVVDTRSDGRSDVLPIALVDIV